MDFIIQEQPEETTYFIKCSIKWTDKESDIIVDTNFEIIKFDNDSTIYKQINLGSDFPETYSITKSKFIENKEINNIYKNEDKNYLILYDDRTVQYIKNNEDSECEDDFGKIFF
jgi:hypothetical protein